MKRALVLAALFWVQHEERLRSDPARRGDYAGVLLHLGRAAEAVPILEALEREKPVKYETAANLGTAYELSGRDAEALRWIAEGIRRNPKSHHGTEWLHVRILEAKLALAADPKWLETHSVLGLDFGAAPVRSCRSRTGRPTTAASARARRPCSRHSSTSSASGCSSSIRRSRSWAISSSIWRTSTCSRATSRPPRCCSPKPCVMAGHARSWRSGDRRTSAGSSVIGLTSANNVGTFPEVGIERRKPMSEMKKMPFDEVIPEFFE